MRTFFELIKDESSRRESEMMGLKETCPDKISNLHRWLYEELFERQKLALALHYIPHTVLEYGVVYVCIYLDYSKDEDILDTMFHWPFEFVREIEDYLASSFGISLDYIRPRGVCGFEIFIHNISKKR